MHLDGYDQRELLAGRGHDKRREFFYWTDDGNLAGLRYDQYKAVFMEQPAPRIGGLDASRWFRYGRRSCSTCAPTRSSALSRKPATTSKWFIEHLFVLVPAQAIVAQHLQSFQEFPPRQKPGSFSVEQVMREAYEPEIQQLAGLSCNRKEAA